MVAPRVESFNFFLPATMVSFAAQLPAVLPRGATASVGTACCALARKLPVAVFEEFLGGQDIFPHVLHSYDVENLTHVVDKVDDSVGALNDLA